MGWQACHPITSYNEEDNTTHITHDLSGTISTGQSTKNDRWAVGQYQLDNAGTV